jgi:hypothetical protein
MICDINAPLAAKLAAIREREPDQLMAREGVPVSIGGEAFEVRPLTRAAARAFKLRQWQYIQYMAGAPALARDASNVEAMSAHEERRAELHAAMLVAAIPELAGREAWLDEQATDLELAEALTVQTALIDAVPNVGGAQALDRLRTLASRTPTPSSASSTRPTPQDVSTKN